MSADNLVKIHLELPKSEEVGGESFWAEDLGNDLYRLRNTPFYANGINFYDIVYAKASSDELQPSILRIHEYSGHKSLRVIFLDTASVEERGSRLKTLNNFSAFHENANGNLFAIDVEPEGDYSRVCDELFKWESRGILSSETSELRDGGGFDSA